jgi:hypothetical protein
VVLVGEVVVVVVVVAAEDEGGEEMVDMAFEVRENIDNLEWRMVYVGDCPSCQFSNQNVIPEQYRPADVRMDCNSLHMVAGSCQCPFPYHQELLHVAWIAVAGIVAAASWHLVQHLSPVEGIHDQVPWELGNAAEESPYAGERDVSNAKEAFDEVKFEVYHDAKIVFGQIR